MARTPPPPGIPQEDWDNAYAYRDQLPEGSGTREDLTTDLEGTPEERAMRTAQEQQKELVNRQIQQAKDFRGKIPGYEQTLYNQIEGQSKSAIADKQQQIKRQANRRGLLYSGLKTGDQTRAASSIASQAACQKAKVAPELEKLAETMDQLAAKTAQANYADDLTTMSQVYDRALTDARARTAQMAQLGEVAGNVSGYYFGSKNADSDSYEMQKRKYSQGVNPDGTFD
jgi:hypothetical protein